MHPAYYALNRDLGSGIKNREILKQGKRMQFSETPQLQPITPAFHLQILANEQISQLKSATLEILAGYRRLLPIGKSA